MIPSIEAAHLTCWVYEGQAIPRTARVDLVLVGNRDDLALGYREPRVDEAWFYALDRRIGQNGLLKKPPARTLSQLLDDATVA